MNHQFQCSSSAIEIVKMPNFHLETQICTSLHMIAHSHNGIYVEASVVCTDQNRDRRYMCEQVDHLGNQLLMRMPDGAYENGLRK